MPDKAVLEAINYAQEGRFIHAQWIEWLVKAVGCCDDCRRWASRAVEIGGNIETHGEWIRKYDHILSVLRSID